MVQTSITMLRAECLAFASSLERFQAGELEQTELQKRASELGFSLHIFACSAPGDAFLLMTEAIRLSRVQVEALRGELAIWRDRTHDLETRLRAKTPGPDDVG